MLVRHCVLPLYLALIFHAEHFAFSELEPQTDGLITVVGGVLAFPAQDVVLAVTGYSVAVHEVVAFELTAEDIAQLGPEPATDIGVKLNLIQGKKDGLGHEIAGYCSSRNSQKTIFRNVYGHDSVPGPAVQFKYIVGCGATRVVQSPMVTHVNQRLTGRIDAAGVFLMFSHTFSSLRRV